MGQERRTYWFPAKRYGYGWDPPRCWQGWLVLAAYLGLVAVGLLFIDPAIRLGLFLGYSIGLTGLLCLVCWLKGEPPAWRWGGK